MRRRQFITLLGGAVAAASPLWPLAARAQRKPARLALLGSGAAQSSGIFVDALKQGLADNGLVEGQDYVLDVYWAEGEYGRFPALAADAAKQNPSVILATTIAAVRAAQRTSSTIPIVMTTINDPVGAGLVASLARPGGNTTGIANLSEDVTTRNPACRHSDRDCDCCLVQSRQPVELGHGRQDSRLCPGSRDDGAAR
jgi:putative ABC transport system substrate-binding protein